MWHCSYCGQERSDAQAFCDCEAWNRSSRAKVAKEDLPQGMHPSKLSFARDEPDWQMAESFAIDAVVLDEDTEDWEARKRRSEEERIQFTQQISIREILGLMTFLSIVFGVLFGFGDLGIEIVVLILITNFMGIVVGLLVTHGANVPR